MLQLLPYQQSMQLISPRNLKILYILQEKKKLWIFVFKIKDIKVKRHPIISFFLLFLRGPSPQASTDGVTSPVFPASGTLFPPQAGCREIVSEGSFPYKSTDDKTFSQSITYVSVCQLRALTFVTISSSGRLWKTVLSRMCPLNLEKHIEYICYTLYHYLSDGQNWNKKG